MTKAITNEDLTPIEIVRSWLKNAEECYHKINIDNYNAATLSTVNSNKQPNSRIVLVKSVDQDSLMFFTNYKSTKGEEIKLNNKVSLLFYWPPLKQQIRILGKVYKVEREISEQYFNTRPYLSQILAWASSQSRAKSSVESEGKLENIENIESKILFYKNRYPDKVPTPQFWGGYNVYPYYFEFWQEGDFRNHQRIVFKKTNDGFKKYNLYP